MRLEATNKESQYKVWMTDDEVEALARAGKGSRDRLIINLGAYVGLRAFEIPQVMPRHVKREGNGEHYRLRVPEGKDTANGEGKPRNAYLPPDIETDIYTFQADENTAPDEPLIDLSESGVRDVVKRAANRAADESGDEDIGTFPHTTSDVGSLSGFSSTNR